ncbi:3-oxoacyl-ACP reductase FabG [Budviciaceae bacterium BWR-B9]|uniref:3-oxoacyl-ACP reductase FabG n=1 Tax=Limnobaculum allomyrinae TaxID=2791986 RepID=A0ABS1IRW9_9GAMM|nr:3-oxoacyl-ACP reductase FabG [Limnobaculum allomyrinae]
MMLNKICVVTGAGRGIGLEIVKKFSQAGAKMIFAVDMNEQELKSLENQYPNVRPAKLNVCDRPAITAFVDAVKAEFGQIDVLVNNAGITRDAMIGKMTEDDWDAVLNVNLKGVFNMTQAIVALMTENGKGSIITMSSIVGTDGNIGQSNYAATKGGVIAMTKGWAKEFARKGAQIRANCVAPGFTETPMTKDLPEKVLEGINNKTPLGRMATAEDIAEGVLFLASEKAKFITGQVLKIDGGLTL